MVASSDCLGALKPKTHERNVRLHIGKTLLIHPKVVKAYKVQARARVVRNTQAGLHSVEHPLEKLSYFTD